MQKLLIMLIVSLLVCHSVLAEETDPSKVHAFDLQDVRLLDGPFKTAMEKNLEYLLIIDVDRMLWPYHERAGLPTKGERYGGWEQKDLVGQTSGHYLTAISLMYAGTGNEELKNRIDYMVSEMAKAQEIHGNGYVGPVRPEVWDYTFDGSIEVHKWGLGGGYVPWYVVHKTYAGLIDAYVFGDNERALEVVCAFADWAKTNTDTLSDEAFQQMLLAEHGGMAECMADLYEITGDEDYLELAQRFEHRQITDPLAEGLDELTGRHVNTQLPKIIGASKLYNLTGDERHAEISRFFWERIVNTRSFATGGLELREHFFESGMESQCLEWNSGETCSVYNMLKLTRNLFTWDAESRYMDYYERALYNHILGSQDPISGGFTYFYSLRPGHFKIYSTPFDSMWCCVGTGMENHSKYAETIYSHSDDTLWVNLFMPSEVDWKEHDVRLRQETRFPEEDTTNFSVATQSDKRLTLKIRVPYWATQGVSVWINGREEDVEANPQSYLTLSRTWKDGDSVKVRMPMSLRLHRARDDESMAVIMYGPIVLAGELGAEGMPNDISPSQSAHSGTLDPPVPVLLVDRDEDLSSWVERVPGEPLRFRTVGVGNPNDVTLIPLADLHHQRYTVYWETMAPGDWQAPPSLDPETISESELLPGLDYRYFEGAWVNLPDFSDIEVKKTGVVENYDLSIRDQGDNFGIVYSGYLKITEKDEYIFAVRSDDGTRITLAGEELILNDGIHDMISVSSQPVLLTPGFYPFDVEYFEGGGGEGLEIYIHSPTNGSWSRIPKSMLYRCK